MADSSAEDIFVDSPETLHTTTDRTDHGCQTELTGTSGNLHQVSSDSTGRKTQFALNDTTSTSEKSKCSTIVGWDGDDDPEKPLNFNTTKKWAITITLALMTICVTFASSVFSTATIVTAKQFHVSPEVMVLATSLFVLGFAFGPIIFGPMSELYGRKRPMFLGLFVFAIFQIPVAVAQNLQTIFVCRFLGGLFASSPLAIAAGILADLFEPVDRGIAVTVFAGATFIGPVAGPIVGGFITMSHLGWRWTEYITAIMAFFFSSLGYLIIPETFEATLLTWRAQKRRIETNNWALHAQAEQMVINPKDIATRYLSRPFIMLALEPILTLITLYMGFIYAFLYLCFEAYPIAFQRLRGWNNGVGALPFLGLLGGVLVGCAITIWFSLTRFKHIMEHMGHVEPEERLLPMMVGGILLPTGMFWFAWTSNPGILWVPEVLSGIFLGSGVLLIFIQVISPNGVPLVEKH
ncbi:MFS multidrug transporter [Penicillium verhagenii]|uniref:MFS multidrug transporter n=1 Tax=Penicillium verhagenii TaxID=1562060 RepID=UPI0025455908|nr:MFS multidrug transporter [Penicillium verhagenii]KAJ5917243.1 MFS multidrug transporter [Penicillium verhagenii]